jgi:hypothetical protein
MDEGLSLGQYQIGLDRRGGDCDAFGQVLALLNIEDGESFEERDRADLFSRIARALARPFWNEAIGIDNRRALFALANVTAKREGLAEGEPALGREAILDDGAHVDAGIRPAGRRFFGIASGARTADDPQGCTQGTRPASSSAMILVVISS